jgi:hypothetical protein
MSTPQEFGIQERIVDKLIKKVPQSILEDFLLPVPKLGTVRTEQA